ncbi:Hypothetical predicted protein, partial [Olea europaea subsp. europaea]
DRGIAGRHMSWTELRSFLENSAIVNTYSAQRMRRATTKRKRAHAHAHARKGKSVPPRTLQASADVTHGNESARKVVHMTEEPSRTAVLQAHGKAVVPIYTR